MTDFDVLPDIRLWVDDAHVRLISTPIHEGSVIHLKKGITSVVLQGNISMLACSPKSITRLTGECCPVVAHLAKGIENNCPSTSEKDEGMHCEEHCHRTLTVSSS
jgi:hypothetical protein